MVELLLFSFCNVVSIWFNLRVRNLKRYLTGISCISELDRKTKSTYILDIFDCVMFWNCFTSSSNVLDFVLHLKIGKIANF